MEFNRLGKGSGGAGHHQPENRELKTEQQAVDALTPSAALPLSTEGALKSLLAGCAETGVPIFALSRAVKRAYVLLVIDKHHGNLSKTARALGRFANSLSAL